jgi:molybdopterin-guanine dinucleotide biosynthesis protein MobB
MNKGMKLTVNNIPIYSVVAFSGTGKTTLLEKLVAELKARGLRVAVIKHDAHEFEIDREGKDSWRFARAGADVTVVVSQSKAAIMENRPVSIESLIDRITDVDLILTEGYKYGNWPKIAVRRAATGKPLPVPAEECFAIVTDVPEQSGGLCFGLDDVVGLADLIIGDINSMERTGQMV